MKPRNEILYYGHKLLTVTENGVKYVDMRALASAIGLNWATQHTLISEYKSVLKYRSCVVQTTEGAGECTYCIPINRLQGWLILVMVKTPFLSPVMQDNLLIFQMSCVDALTDTYHKNVYPLKTLDRLQEGSRTLVNAKVEESKGLPMVPVENPNITIKHIIKVLGGPTQVGKVFGLHVATISSWGTKNKVPTKWIKKFSEMAGMTGYERVFTG